jgi:hypothetical protein
LCCLIIARANLIYIFSSAPPTPVSFLADQNEGGSLKKKGFLSPVDWLAIARASQFTPYAQKSRDTSRSDLFHDGFF